MDQEQERYDRLIRVIRESKPDPGDIRLFSEKVIGKIQKERTSVSATELIYDFIFGWVYIGWMRRSLAGAAILLTLFFGYQQMVMMKKIDALSLNAPVTGDLLKSGSGKSLNVNLRMYSLFGKRAGELNVEINEKEIDKFIESVNDLQEKYKDLFRMIETDPELKKYVNDRLNKYGAVKPKI